MILLSLMLWPLILNLNISAPQHLCVYVNTKKSAAELKYLLKMNFDGAC